MASQQREIERTKDHHLHRQDLDAGQSLRRDKGRAAEAMGEQSDRSRGDRGGGWAGAKAPDRPGLAGMGFSDEDRNALRRASEGTRMMLRDVAGGQ